MKGPAKILSGESPQDLENDSALTIRDLSQDECSAPLFVSGNALCRGIFSVLRLEIKPLTLAH